MQAAILFEKPPSWAPLVQATGAQEPCGRFRFGSPDQYPGYLNRRPPGERPIAMPSNSTRCLPTYAAQIPDAHRTPTQPARRRRNNSTLFLLPGTIKHRQNERPREVWEICYMRPRLPLGLAFWCETGGSLTQFASCIAILHLSSREKDHAGSRGGVWKDDDLLPREPPFGLARWPAQKANLLALAMQHQIRDGPCLGSNETSCKFRPPSCLSSRQSPPAHQTSWIALKMRHRWPPQTPFFSERKTGLWNPLPGLATCHVTDNVSIWGVD